MLSTCSPRVLYDLRIRTENSFVRRGVCHEEYGIETENDKEIENSDGKIDGFYTH
jgi:hypothetical protein